MKKYILVTGLFLLGFFCIGCALASNKGTEIERNSGTETVGYSEKTEKGTEEAQSLPFGDKHVCSVIELGDGIEAFIIGEQDNNISCEIINISENTVLAEMTNINFDCNMTIERHGKNLVIYTMSGQVFILDDKYKITDTIDMSEYKFSGFSQKYVIDPVRKKKIVCIQGGTSDTMEEIVEMDYDDSGKRVLLEIVGPEKENQINAITDMKLSEDGESIFLLGQYFESAEPGEVGKGCIGVLDVKSMKKHIYRTELAFFQAYENMCFYYEGIVDYGKEAGGKIIILYPDGKKEDVEFDEKWASQCLFISDRGSYLGVYAEPDFGTKTPAVSIYDRKSGEQMGNIRFGHKLYELLICEDNHTIYGFYYDNGKSKMEEEKF